jgi:hypothetical protein
MNRLRAYKLHSSTKVALLYAGEQWNNAAVSAPERFGQKKSEIKVICRIKRARCNGVRRDALSGT